MVGEAASVLGVVTLESRELQQPERIVAVEPTQIPQSSLTLDHEVALHKIFSETPGASTNPAFMKSFNDQHNMMLYHINEMCRQHGGLQYLVSRAFRQTPHFSNAAHVDESLWHFRSMVQFISMSDKQKKRQAKILTTMILKNSHAKLFPTTFVPSFRDMNRLYGRSNQHTMWRCLPIPTVTCIDGIAYTNPINVIRHLLAFSTEVDLFMVCGNEEVQQQQTTTTGVLHVTQSKWAQEWKKQIKEKYPAINAILLWVVDWRDGFGANRTKQNRKSTNAWTFSVATPQHTINSLNNTLPIALGLKKNPSWSLVEDQFRSDMSSLGDGLEP
jgi:hypothetical protein